MRHSPYRSPLDGVEKIFENAYVIGESYSYGMSSDDMCWSLVVLLWTELR
jgi:hypothetical protein